jgi:hypothetical protein
MKLVKNIGEWSKCGGLILLFVIVIISIGGGGFARGLEVWSSAFSAEYLWGVLEGLRYARSFDILSCQVVYWFSDSCSGDYSNNRKWYGTSVGEVYSKYHLDWEVTDFYSYRKTDWCADALLTMGCSLDFNFHFFILVQGRLVVFFCLI